MCGLITYINYSGAIITGILFIVGLIFFKSKISKKFCVIAIALIFFIFFSGGEFSQYKNFIFNKKLISLENQEKTFESKELESYKIREKESEKTLKESEKTLKEDEKINKKDILIKGKLQGFTQIQFFGLIYLFFLFILILTLAKRKRIDLFSKLNLSFIGLFFFIVMDPFFLNPHKYAYVLSISPKYTFLLLPFVVLLISQNFKYFNQYLNKFKTKYLLLLGIIPFFLLFPRIKYFSSIVLYRIVKNFIPLYNSQEYYLERIDKLLTWTIFSSILIFAFYIINNIKKEKNNNNALKEFIFILLIFVIPYFYILSNNYNIINTFRYINSEDTLKTLKTTENPKSKTLYQAIYYINNELPTYEKIFIHFKAPTTSYSKAWYYIKNNQRLLSPEKIESGHEISSHSKYALIDNSLLQNNSSIKNWHLIKQFGNLSLIKFKNE
jgi:hypothetical protein